MMTTTLHAYKVTTNNIHFLFVQWIGILSIAVLYNLVFIIGRATFWELENAVPTTWYFLDYGADLLYIIDSIIHAHQGN